jgi:hypothetical protein
MTPEELRDMEGETPPAGLAPPFAALWWLHKGGMKVGPEWSNAHEIAQKGEGDRSHDLVHGLVHWIEGDHGNRDYWYRRAGGGSALAGDPESEWERLVGEVNPGPPAVP